MRPEAFFRSFPHTLFRLFDSRRYRVVKDFSGWQEVFGEERPAVLISDRGEEKPVSAGDAVFGIESYGSAIAWFEPGTALYKSEDLDCYALSTHPERWNLLR